MRSYDASGNLIEFIRQPVYDQIEVFSTGVAFRAFVVPRGQNAKTTWHTNMDTSAQLAVPKSHLVDGFRLVPTSKIVDANQLVYLRSILWDRAWVDFTIGALKNYLECPAWYIPAGVGIPGFSDTGGLTTAATIQQVSNGAPIFGNYLSIRTHPILLPSQQTFSFTYHVDVALSAITVTTYLWVVLEGVNGRETM